MKVFATVLLTIALSILLFTQNASATFVTYAYEFTATDFQEGEFLHTSPPLNTVSGSFQITFRPTAGPVWNGSVDTASVTPQIGSTIFDKTNTYFNLEFDTYPVNYVVFGGDPTLDERFTLGFTLDVRTGEILTCPFNCSLTLYGPQDRWTTGQNSFAISQIPATALPTVPLPATLPLFLAALFALGLFGWRRSNAN